MKLSVILLAAGLSLRMGEDKLLVKYNKLSLLQRAVNLIDEINAFEKIIITTKQRAEQLTLPQGVKLIINTDPVRGLSSSIRLGTESSSGTHYLFMAADQPKLTVTDINLITDTAKNNPDKIIYPVIFEEPYMPSVFPETFRKKLLKLTGDTGGREIRDTHPEKCLIVYPANPENFKDIDTVEDYYAIN